MSLDGRIRELKSKHQKLDNEISVEQKRPALDSLRLRELKRQKLRIKEQLGTLEA